MDDQLPLDIDLYSQFIETVKQEVENADLNLCPVSAREPDASEFITQDEPMVLFSVSN
ncbi:MAG: hypothetical protein J6J00_00465 [Treponema sp.]|nr:hypothetical protein [Treponema sp.]